MAVRTNRIAQQQAQLLAVRQQSEPLAARQQHALRTAHRAEPIGPAAACGASRSVSTATDQARSRAPHRRLHQPAAVLDALARRHLVLTDGTIETADARAAR